MHAPQTRWGAFLIHLGLSAIIFLVLLYFIVFHWYPQPFFATDGGWEGVRLITGVDLVLGPMLTLIVYKLGKPGLKLDLTLIGVTQVIALAAGTWLVHGERIALASYANGAFYTLTPEQVEMIGGPAREISRTMDHKPPISYVRLPDNPREKKSMLNQAMLQGMLPYHLADRHEPYGPQHLPTIMAAGTDPAQISKKIPGFATRLEALLQQHGGGTQDYVFVPSLSRYGEQLLLLRKQDGALVDGIRLPSGTVAKLNTPATAPRP